MKLSYLLFLFLSPVPVPFTFCARATSLRHPPEHALLKDPPDDDPFPDGLVPFLQCDDDRDCLRYECCLRAGYCGVEGYGECKFKINAGLPFFVDCEKLFSNTRSVCKSTSEDEDAPLMTN
jgi:hypothetical protein